MNRKLHNTTMALIASSSLFVLGLITAAPVEPTLSPAPAPAVVVALDADSVAVADSVEQAGTPPRRHLRRNRQQSVAMPFFSFAPRG